MFKSELRKNYLARQKSFSAAPREEKSLQIAARFFQSFDLTRIEFLHCFLPIEKFGEIETKLIFDRVWRDFPALKTLVPRVNFQINEIENLIYSSDSVLVKNSWQIDEPAHNDSIVAEKIDLVIVLLLSFDKRGFRVGYGKGFYDKFLKNCRADCLKIGLSYFEPVAEIFDAQSYDAPLDFCVTAKKLWSFTTKEKAVQIQEKPLNQLR